MSYAAKTLFFSLIVALSLAPIACSKSSDTDSDSDLDANGLDAPPDASTAGPGEEADAGDAGTSDLDDAGTSDPDAGVDDEPAYTGCDLMEFAPENRNGQGTESALLNLKAPSLGYFKELSWFTAEDVWMLDALNLSTRGSPIAFPTGRYELEGENLGNRDDCTLCLDLSRANMDTGGIDVIYYPEEAWLDVEQADLQAGGALKFTISGRFRKNGDATGESWCVNQMLIDTTLAQFCSAPADCPAALPVCDYPATGAYPVCQPESAD